MKLGAKVGAVAWLILAGTTRVQAQAQEEGRKEGRASYDRGLAAYELDDYKTALKNWLPLAERGDVGSQNGVAMLYGAGKGVPQNYVLAHKWTNIYQSKGELNELIVTRGGKTYLFGRTPGKGGEVGYAILELYAKEMTAEQVAKAERLAINWFRDSDGAPSAAGGSRTDAMDLAVSASRSVLVEPFIKGHTLKNRDLDPVIAYRVPKPEHVFLLVEFSVNAKKKLIVPVASLALVDHKGEKIANALGTFAIRTNEHSFATKEDNAKFLARYPELNAPDAEWPWTDGIRSIGFRGDVYARYRWDEQGKEKIATTRDLHSLTRAREIRKMLYEVPATRVVNSSVVFGSSTLFFGPKVDETYLTSVHGTKELDAAVQAKLNAAGHNVGKVDGLWGSKSSAGLKLLQKANELQVTGRLNYATLSKLGLASSAKQRNPENPLEGGGERVDLDAATHAQERSIEALENIGGKVTFDSGFSVDLEDSLASDADLVHLQGFTKLKSVSLPYAKVTDKGLVYLKGLTSLQQLDLTGTKITDAGLAHLKELSELDALDLTFTKVTDTGLGHLKGLTKVKLLKLVGTKITDDGLVHLEGMTKLETLNLVFTKVTDAGLLHLDELDNLKLLMLQGTKVTESGMKKLRAELPKCNIYKGEAPP